MNKNGIDDVTRRTDLHDAIAADDVERVRCLLAEGADVQSRDSLGHTPLMRACTARTFGMRKTFNMARKASELAQARPARGTKLPRLDPKQIFAEMKADRRQPDDSLPKDDATIPLLLLEHHADINATDPQGYSPLMLAAIAGRAATVRLLLEHGADLHAQDNDGLTPLMLAAQWRRLEVVQLLLDAGASPDYRTPSGFTALMAAAEGGRVEIARLLLKSGLDVNAISANGTTALLRAVLREHEAMAAFLLAAGADVDFLVAVAQGDIEMARRLPVPAVADRPPGWGHRALFQAVKNGRADIVRLLLERGIDPNALNKANQSALMSAVMRGDLECARALLEAGADPDGVPGGLVTPLQWAGQFGYTEIADLLLTHRASLNAFRHAGGGALSAAVMGDNLEVARRLLAAGANPNEKGPGDLSPLHFAAMRDNCDMVRLLLDYGASPHATGLQAMVRTLNRPEIARMLKQAHKADLHDLARTGKTTELLARLADGADIDGTDESGETLLIAALRGKQTELAGILIERGANIHMPDYLGHTPLICAAIYNDTESVRRLIARGADVATTDDFGWAAISYAALANRQDIVALLVAAGGAFGPVEAALLGELDALLDLLGGGSGVNASGAGGVTPLMGAARSGDVDMIVALLQRDADLNALDEQGRTPLAWAVAYRHHRAARLLLDHGAEVDKVGENSRFQRRLMARLLRDFDGTPPEGMLTTYRAPTPLAIAATQGDVPLADLLLARGANIDATGGIWRHTPLAMAANAGKREMVRFLLERGADPNITDEQRYTALRQARRTDKYPEIVAILEEHAARQPVADVLPARYTL